MSSLLCPKKQNAESTSIVRSYFQPCQFWDRSPLRLDRLVAERIKGPRSKEIRWTHLGMPTKSKCTVGQFFLACSSTDHVWLDLVHFPPHLTPRAGMLSLASSLRLTTANRPGKKLIAQLGVSPNGHVFLTLTSLLKQLSSRLAGQDEADKCG